MKIINDILCADSKCPSRDTCRRYTTATKLAVGTFGRVHGEDKCVGFVEVFEKPAKKSSRKVTSGYKSKGNKPIQNDDFLAGC